jgi:hypothetical protein
MEIPSPYPVERFFEELEGALVEALQEYFEDTEKVKQLCAYPWILEQIQNTE